MKLLPNSTPPPSLGLFSEGGLTHTTGCVFRTCRTINEQLIPHRTWHFRVMVVHLSVLTVWWRVLRCSLNDTSQS